MTSPDELDAIPLGSVLLYAGLAKTGTTSMQTTLARLRPELRDLGVVYPGTAVNHRHEFRVFGDLRLHFGDRWVTSITDQHRAQWRSLVEETRAANEQRVILAHESAARFSVEKRLALPEALGRPVHVVITVRNLADALPSSYQEKVKMGRTTSFRDWLEQTLELDPWSEDAKGATRLLDYGRDARQWAEAVGAENVTVIALDPHRREIVPRAFERMLALPEGVLEPGPMTGQSSNRSLTAAETALLLGVNRVVDEYPQFTWEQYWRWVLDGPVASILSQRVPPADEVRMSPPQWAVDRAQEIARHCNDELAALGIRVVGDPATLATGTVANDVDPDDITTMPADLSITAVAGAVLLPGLMPEPPEGRVARLRRRARSVLRRVRRAATVSRAG